MSPTVVVSSRTEMNRQKLVEFYKKHTTYLTVTPILVTISITAASFIISGIIDRNLTSVQNQAVNKQVRENQLLIQSAFQSYSQIVWSGVGRVNSGPVDRVSWGKFVGTYQFSDRFPAIRSLILSQSVPQDQKEAMLLRLSQEYGQEIRITNDSEGTISILMYSSPERSTTINNVGLNISSDAIRAKTMQRATDLNAIAMTDQLELFVDARQQKTASEAAFLLYAPYYAEGASLDTVEQRRAAIRGHVAASFRTEEFFKQVFDRIDHSHVAIDIQMVSSDNKTPAYVSNATNPSGPKILRTQTLEVYGQKFKINYAFDSNYLVSMTQLRSPLYTVLFGMLTAVLVGTVTYFFLRGRHHLLLLDKERDIARAKDELLSLASHQLRTPATGVKQYMGMVLQGFAGTITKQQEELLSKAYKSNERQLHVINDVLHLAKLDLGRIVLAKTNFDLAELIDDVIEEQEQDIEANELKISVKLPKKTPVYADSHMMRMVVENIISNAVKYTDPKGRITVRLRTVDDTYEISVKDTGVGIAKSDISRLFKQFSRLTNPRSHLVTGTGVGLYLARHLVQLHDGDIIVESKEGIGSTFTIILPKKE